MNSFAEVSAMEMEQVDGGVNMGGYYATHPQQPGATNGQLLQIVAIVVGVAASGFTGGASTALVVAAAGSGIAGVLVH